MKKAFVKTGKESRVAYVDLATGEIISEELQTHKYLANDNEQFFFCYYSLVAAMQKLKGPAIQTYFYLVLNYKPGTLIGINKAVKNEIKTHIGSKSLGTISNCLTQLCRENLLVKGKDASGGYYINPRFTYKGGSSERKKSLLFMIENVSEAA
jgi:hypothetical protein